MIVGPVYRYIFGNPTMLNVRPRPAPIEIPPDTLSCVSTVDVGSMDDVVSSVDT